MTQTMTSYFNRPARIYCGELVDGEFTDVALMWDGPYRLALPTLWMLMKEIPSKDFYWNAD